MCTYFFNGILSFVDDGLVTVLDRITSTRNLQLPEFIPIPRMSCGECLFYHFTQKDRPHVILEARSLESSLVYDRRYMSPSFTS